ncbi:MAG: metal ABC transporter permease [Lachnospiraceae bacterium]|nr:metal ABC transporter permease [Lachnospiraceae bacterium]
MEVIKSLFEYEFIIKAFEVGIIVSLCSALLGVSLVLKRYSMIGDGLSHVSFGAISIAVAFGLAPLAVSVPVVVVAAFLLLHMRENGKMKGDAAIAAMSASALAIGVTVTSLTTGMTTDVSTYMFGSILAMTDSDVILSILLSIMVLILFIFCYHKIFAVTFDESFSKATGVNVSLYNTLVAILTAVTIVLGMRMMGAMLISSLIIFPALSSMRIFKSFLGVVLSSGVTAVVCFCIGMIVSYRFSTPVGASIVIINLCVFFICCIIQRVQLALNNK